MEATTMQGKDVLRKNRLSCGNTASIDFVMFKPRLVQTSFAADLVGCKPHSDDGGDARPPLGDVSGVSAMQRKNAQAGGNCRQNLVTVTIAD
jgi:hypothetical protein